jgi:hypothetical protein
MIRSLVGDRSKDHIPDIHIKWAEFRQSPVEGFGEYECGIYLRLKLLYQLKDGVLRVQNDSEAALADLLFD